MNNDRTLSGGASSAGQVGDCLAVVTTCEWCEGYEGGDSN